MRLRQSFPTGAETQYLEARALRALLELAVSYPKGAIKVTMGDPKISFQRTGLPDDEQPADR
jgi:hypothetical protein